MNSNPLTPILTIVDGQATALSTDVSQHFDKRHDDVLKAIRNLLPELDADYLRNFAEVTVDYINGKGGTQTAPAYRMTRDGFTLLAMGFNGKRALQFKQAYIKAFNQMEAALRIPPTTRAFETLTTDEVRHLEALVRGRAAEWGERRQRAVVELWNRLSYRFHITVPGQLPRSRLAEVEAWLAMVPLKLRKPPPLYHPLSPYAQEKSA